MRDFVSKADASTTSSGRMTAAEYNSLLSENENVVTPFMELNELQYDQMSRSIDIATKANWYYDNGTANAVHLVRSSTAAQIEMLADGIMVFFSPAHNNTGAATLKLNHLSAKPIHFNNANIVSGMLVPTMKYMAVYSSASDAFNLDVVASGIQPSEILSKSDIETLIHDYADEREIACKANRGSGWEIFSANSKHGIIGSFVLNKGFTADIGTGLSSGSYIVVPRTGYYMTYLNSYYSGDANTGRLLLSFTTDNANSFSNACFTEPPSDTGGDNFSISSQALSYLSAGTKFFYICSTVTNNNMYHSENFTEVSIHYIGD